MEALIAGISKLMWPAMALWLLIGLVCLSRDVLAIGRDEKALGELKELTKRAQGSDYQIKMAIRMDLVGWADKNVKTFIARWIYTVHNAVYAGGQGDAAALADAIWSAERERHYWFRYFARNAIMVGLFFTSVGLCETLSGVAPALTADASTHNAWLQAVQAAMANALGGMAAAFYSSLAGLFISLVLSLLANIFLVGRHETYLHQLDAYLQGSLIPVFTSIVEKDRNDLIREMLSRTEESFDGIQKQFKALVEQNQAQYKDLSSFRQSLAKTVKDLDAQLALFGNGLVTLTHAGTGLVAAANGISQALEGGVERLALAHEQALKHGQDFQDDVIHPFIESVTEQAQKNADSHLRVLADLSKVSVRFETLVSGFETETERARQVNQQQQAQIERTQQDMLQLSTKFAGDTDRFHKDWYQMAQYQHGVLSQAAGEQKQVLASISGFVDSFSIAGEAVHRQLAEIYALHQQEVEKLYQSIGGRLAETLDSVAIESSKGLAEHLTSGLTTALVDTHERMTGLDAHLRALIAQHAAGMETTRALQEAVSLNADDLKTELLARRAALDSLLQESVSEIQATLSESLESLRQRVVDDGHQVFGALSDRLAGELQASLTRQEKIVSDLNETVGRKWEHLLTAYEGSISTSQAVGV